MARRLATMHLRPALACLALVVAVVVAACGGGVSDAQARKIAAEWFSDAEKAAFLGNAQALLFPIDWPEPFGLVMTEAMACGTPVIATPRGSVPEVIEDGVTGFTFREFTPEAFWRALQRALLVHNTDASAWAALRRNGMTANFSWSEAARRYERLYEEAFARERPVRG